MPAQAKRIPIPFAEQHGERIARTINTERLVNWSADKIESHGKSRAVLQQRPGLTTVSTLGTGPHRGSLEHVGVMYIVSGGSVYSVNSAETATFIASINTHTGRVGMASNGTQLIIVDGADGWLYNSTTMVWSQITDVDFVDAQQVVFFHGRFVVIKPNTGEFYISGLYDGATWTALDFANAEVDPDNLKALNVLHQELWLLGDYTTQIYVDTGNPVFPYEPQPGGMIEWGIAAQWTAVKGDNTLFWLAKTRDGHGSVIKATGYAPQVISSDALEEAIGLYSRIDDAFAFIMKPNDKALWYVLTFPTANVTWVFDATTSLWHQWSSYGVGRFKGATHCFFNTRHYIGSDTDGTLYRMEATAFKDGTDPIERIATGTHVSNNQNQVFWHSLEVLFDAGVGLATGQGSDPQAMLRWSDDGGYTYGNSHWRSIGKIGEYRNRAVWRRLGRSRHRVYELTVTDPVNAVVVGLYAQVSSGVD